MNASRGRKLGIRAIQVVVGVVLAYETIFVTHQYIFAILTAAFVFVWSCRLYFEFRERDSN
jgi:hypothetical protein